MTPAHLLALAGAFCIIAGAICRRAVSNADRDARKLRGM